MELNKEILRSLGLGDCGLISPTQIEFGDEIRAICAGNGCRRYGTTWACPPAVGTVEECKARCLQFEHALVFNQFSNESCHRCEKCTYPDAPCRFPERLMPTVEGYGIYVNKLAETAGLEYINGPDTVTYFGMLLY